MNEERRRKAKNLIELALDESTTDEERNNASMRAIKLIRKYDLLSSPLDGVLEGNETVQAIRGIVETITGPKFKGDLRKVATAADRFRRR
jgi:hypothetical protein